MAPKTRRGKWSSCRIRLPIVDYLPACTKCTLLLDIAIVDEVRQLLYSWSQS
jgi:hypothetical protein